MVTVVVIEEQQKNKRDVAFVSLLLIMSVCKIESLK